MIVVVKRVKQNLARIVHFVIQASIIVTVRLGTISEIDVVDLKFRVFYILLLNSITVKNVKFQVYLHQKRVHYPKVNRKLHKNHYVHFSKQLCTFSKPISSYY